MTPLQAESKVPPRSTIVDCNASRSFALFTSTLQHLLVLEDYDEFN